MIDSYLRRASDDLWQNVKDQQAADHILGSSPSDDGDVQLEADQSKDKLEIKKKKDEEKAAKEVEDTSAALKAAREELL
jgi:hypothetical protein